MTHRLPSPFLALFRKRKFFRDSFNRKNYEFTKMEQYYLTGKVFIVVIVRWNQFGPYFPQLFDIPSEGDSSFEDRTKKLSHLFGLSGSYACSEVKVVEQVKAKDKDHVLSFLKDIESRGGEGVMLREPGSKYEGRRSSTLLKLKVRVNF